MSAEEGTETSDNKEKSKKEHGLKEMVSQFLERSTLPAVGVMQQKISIFWRVVWILVVLCGIGISIYQSIELINNYLRYPSFLTEEEDVNSTVYFPAVTLCAQNIVDWDRVNKTNHSMGHIIAEAASITVPGEDPVDRRVRLERILMRELHRLDKAKREEFHYTYDEWLRICYIERRQGDSQNCTEIDSFIISVYSPFYGPCVTINPGLKPESMLKEDSRNKMILIAEFNKEMEFPYMARSNGLLVSIHPPGSAPVIHWNPDLVVLPGEWLNARIKVYDITRLPSPYSSNCTGDDSMLRENIHRYSPFQSETLEYLYSREECMATCYFWSIIEKKNCINPFIAVNDFIDALHLDLCVNTSFDNRLLEEVEDFCSQTCRKRCREFIYSWTPVTLNLPKDKGYINDLLDLVSVKTNTKMEEMIFVTLQMDSTAYKIGEETPKYELEDVLGAIGGNLGLWIGISILTLFEVFELMTNVIVFYVQKLFRLCKKKI